jgi:prolyl 4-hydroxylase
VLVGDREVRVLARNAALGIYYLGDFLSDAECAAMIGHAGGKLAKSTVVDDDATGFVVSDRRSSEGAMFMRGENDTARAIERRIARLTDLPVDFGEGLQVLHYGPGGEYRPHFDYFNPDTEGGKANLHRHGQRLVTVVMYLADVTNGGGTLFPELSLEFAATRGAALMFASAARDGSLLKTSLHAGCPVIAGEKWIATKWIRPFPYEGRAA